MRQSHTLDIGMDVHQDSMAVADVAQEHGAAGTSLGTLGTRHCDLDHLLRQLPSQAKPLRLVYAAGPWGSWLDRYRTHQGHHCWVVAPSLIPKQAGARVNTDRRDAMPLARLMRSGDLTPVSVPTVDDEAVRDLTRAREDPRRDLKAATWRLNAFWLRQDLRSTGRATWSPAQLRWLSAVVWATPAQPIVFQAYVRAVHEHTARLHRLQQARQEQVQSWRLQPVVEALEARRGVPFTVAVPLVAELGDLTRVENPRPLMQYLGLIPSAYASGERRRQGSITTAGNPHARRALGAGAWAYRDSRHSQSASTTAARTTTENHPGPQLEGASPTGHTRSTLERPRQTREPGGGSPCPRIEGLDVGQCSAHGCDPEGLKTAAACSPSATRFSRPSAETPPRCGVTRGSVTRPKGILGPSMRPAPDGCQSGGRPPTDLSVINRRVFLAPDLPMNNMHGEDHENRKK